MTIKEVLKLSPIDGVEKEILLAFVLNKNRSFINAFSEAKVEQKDLSKFQRLSARRQKREPIPYLLGFKEFYGRNFFVDKNVLIPRPETENLLEAVLHFVGDQNLTVIDVGTGSGCLALSLKLEKPNLEVFASDTSDQALRVARKNARLLRIEPKVKFLKSDLLEDLTEKVDVIVANLPYIPIEKWEKLPAEIKDFEPKLALDSGRSSMVLYEKLFTQAPEKLNTNGKIFYELDGQIKTWVAHPSGKVQEQRHLL